MEGISIIIDIVVIVFGVLSLILFFKLWKMCDDVKEIAASIKEIATNTASIKDSKSVVVDESGESVVTEQKSLSPKFEVSQRVIVKEDESQFKIADVQKNEDGSVLYYSDWHNRYFTEDEIEDFKVYWSSKK